MKGYDVWQWIGGPLVAVLAILLFGRYRRRAMANQPEAAESGEVPAGMTVFLPIARVLSSMAVVLGAIASLCGLVIVVGGQFSCAQFEASHSYRPSVFIALPFFSLFIMVGAKMMASGRNERFIKEFRKYDAPLFNRFSPRITLSTVFFSSYLALIVAAIGVGISLSLAPLWSILTECVKRAG